MDNEKQFKPDANGAMLGRTQALIDAVRALVVTHPDPAAFQREFHQEWRASLDLPQQLGSGQAAIDVYRETCRSLDPSSADA